MYARAFLTSSKTALTAERLRHYVGLQRMVMSTTVQESTSSSSQADETLATRGRRRKQLPKRPPISNLLPRPWCRPVADGVLPAYDFALDLLKADSAQILSEAETLRAKIMAAEENRAEVAKQDSVEAKATVDRMDDEIEGMRRKLRILEVQGEVNLPEIRWKVANAMPDMNKAVDRHLLEQRWRRDGGLDLLMERLYQMKVVPDLLSEMHPSIDVRITVPTLGRVPDKVFQNVEPGMFLFSKQTVDPPKVYANIFHTDTRLYTLVMVDADVPDEASASYTTYLHWMQPNIPLSAHTTSRILNLSNHTKYIPPHPQKGTPYHRYVLLLLLQPPKGASKYSLNVEARAKPNEPTSLHLDIPVVSDKQRVRFDLRSFMREWGFDMREGGGAHMWREVWDENVSTIYKDILKLPEPRYGRPRKANPYTELKHTKRYIS